MIDGRYEILDDIDTGGFGEVYKVSDITQPSDAPLLALKMLRLALLSDPASVSRLKREITLGVELPHPNLIEVLDHGEEAGQLWYVMPYAEGGNLTHAVPSSGWDPAQVLAVLTPIADAVAYLHAHSALHRDISSNNVLRVGSEWLLSDLGLSVSSLLPTSLVTSTGVSGMGAFGYVSPEQRISLRSATTRSDIYSLGKLVQFMSEGRWPEHPPAMSGPLGGVIAHATRLVPEQRYPTVGELVQAVRVVAGSPPGGGSVADRVDEFVALARTVGSTRGAQLVSLIAALDPADEYDQKQIGRVLRAASQQDWKAAFGLSPDQTLHAVELAAQAIHDEAEFAILDGLMAGLLNADRAIDDPQVRHRVVATLAHIGSRNNRWSYRKALVELLTNRTPVARMAATVDGLREAGPEAARWVLENVRLDPFPNPLRAWLQNVMA